MVMLLNNTVYLKPYCAIPKDLPESILQGTEDVLRLLPWSIIKRKKKWIRNKRLQKKFIRNTRIYIPEDIRRCYETHMDHLYHKASEDKHLLELMKQAENG